MSKIIKRTVIECRVRNAQLDIRFWEVQVAKAKLELARMEGHLARAHEKGTREAAQNWLTKWEIADGDIVEGDDKPAPIYPASDEGEV